MRMVTGKGGLLLVAVALACMGTPARADELLMMPYSCRMVGGAPVLTPAPDEVHQIIGRREHLPFSVCSPASPGRCRRWTLYRFELICGGVRVPWVAVAAAAAQRRNQRAWAANGRLHLEMPPHWNMPDNDPCAREWGYGERWGYGGLGRYCAEHRFDIPPFVVEMPAGFAPTFGIGVFVAAGPPGFAQGIPTGALPGAPAMPGAPATGAPPGTAPGVSHAPLPPAAGAPPVTTAPGPTQPSRSARAEVPTAPAAHTESAAKPTPAKKPPAKAEHGQPAAAPTPEPAPVIPKIINSSEPARGPAMAAPAALPPPVVPPPEVVTPHSAPPPAASAPPVAASAPPVAPPTAASAQPSPPPAESPPPESQHAPSAPDVAGGSSAVVRTAPGSGAIAVNLIAAVGNNPTSVAVAIAGFVMLVLAAFTFARQREQARLNSTVARDLATLSLDGGHLVVAESGPAQNVGTPLPPDVGDAIPRTLNEALHILGMGVTAAASEVAIKKVVDGLRLSWHPDYAISPDDRKLRELRTKQINAAWDIIKGKRPQA